MTYTFTKPVTNETIEGTGHGATITAGTGIDLLIGTPGSDTIYGNDNGDQIKDGSGDDTVYGGAGDDWITTGKGADTVYGGAGNDYIATSGSHSHLYAGAGDDWLQGGTGNDNWLVGGSGDDFIQAGSGNNLLAAGQGSDTLVGGSGTDQFHWTASDFNHPKGSSDLLIGFDAANGDTIHLTGILTQAALDAAIANPGVEQSVGETNAANIVGVTVSYGEDPTGYVNPVNHVHYTDNASMEDTHIVFTYHSGATADIWAWDAQLTSSDFVIA